MTIASTVTRDEYIGNGVTTSFPLTFEYTDPNEISVTVDGLQQLFTFDDAQNPSTVIFDTAPLAGQEVLLARVTPLTQEVQLDQNSNFGDVAESLEKGLDKVVQMVQELTAGQTVVVPSGQGEASAIFEEWDISTNYKKNQLLRDGTNGKFYTVVNDFTSNAFNIESDITANKLVLFNRGEKGAKGDKGEKGNNGANGAQGPQGLRGNDGVDGIFSQIATQAEAETGVDNLKGMTALRVRQAIDLIVPQIISATNLRLDLTALQSLVGQINSEVQQLKGSLATTLGRYTGRQQINQNQVAPLAITADVGSPMKFNSVGTEFVHLQVYIRRGAVSSTNFELVAQWINGEWKLARKDTLLLNETLEFDGVTLTIETTGNEGQIKYTSEPVAGPYVAEEHYISWIGQEIRQGVLL